MTENEKTKYEPLGPDTESVKNEGTSDSMWESGASEYTPEENAAPAAPEQSVKENVAAGIVGAFLFALAGGIIYFVIYQLGFIAGIAGFVAVIAAIKGYSLFAKKESLKGVIISIVLAVAVIVLAEYFSLSYAIMEELEGELSFFESARYTWAIFIDPEFGDFRIEVIKELAIALVICAVSAFGAVRNAIGANKAKK